MEQKIAVITGGTGGIGGEVCSHLISSGYEVYVACRRMEKGKILMETLQKRYPDMVDMDRSVHFIPADLVSFSSVDNFCNCILESLEGRKIDLLINNAGAILPRFTVTEDGYEGMMQINYLSAMRITEKLLPNIRGKVINTLSCTVVAGTPALPEKYHKGSDEHKLWTLKSLELYSNAKLMLALYTIDLHKRAAGLEIMGADPGIVDTGIITMGRWYDPIANILFRPFIKSAASGALPIIRAIEYSGEDRIVQSGNSPKLFKGDKIRCFPKRVLDLFQRKFIF